MKKTDRFADIANNYSVEGRSGLVAPRPPRLSGQVFPLTDGGIFTPTKKMDTREELYAALERAREQAQPFLRNLAPKLTEKPPFHLEFREFSWSFDGAPAKRVTIPHYGPKEGKHCAVYKTDFELPDYCAAEKRVILTFLGVDYIAEVFVNGTFAGRHEGFFAPFELDVSEWAHPGRNVLVVNVKNDFTMTGDSCADGKPTDGDKIYAATGPGWDDPADGWHHCPAGMGIYQRAYVELRENEYLTDLFVRDGKELWIECMSSGIEKKPVAFDVSVYGQNFQETVFEHVRMEPNTLLETAAGDTFTAAKRADARKGIPLPLGGGFNRYRFPISIAQPRVWSPECPHLYQVQVRMFVDGCVTSAKACQFGIRTFTEDAEGNPKGMFFLNGKKLRLRGANTMGFEQQDVMRGDEKQLLDDMLLAKLCHMNFLRLTQRPVQKEIYEMCDRVGLMIQTDLPMFGTVRINQTAEVIRQAGEMEYLIRSHPCCILVTYINEPVPNGDNKPHRMLCRSDMDNLFKAADFMVHLNNPDRVTKHVDGDYDPPCASLPDSHCYTMWYNGHGVDLGRLHKGYWQKIKPGWYWGCGEFGTEGLDFPEVMQTRYPKEWIREPFDPKNIVRAQSANMHFFFYDTPHSLTEWSRDSQRYQAFATKLMTNAFRRSNGMVSFAIHLFIDAWPDGWMKSIMDFRREPKPAYFVYRDCLEPLKADLRSDRFTWFGGETLKVEARVCNDGDALKGAELRFMATMGKKVFASGRWPAKIGECRTEYQGMVQTGLPNVAERCTVTVWMAVMKDGKILHWTSEDFTVFPAEEFHAPETVTYREYERRRTEMDKRIENGGTVVFAPLEPGKYNVAGRCVTVKPCAMGPVYFVSGKTGHPLTDGFRPGDFAYWYDSTAGRITPITSATLQADGAETVLSGGNRNESGEMEKADVCAVLRKGKGKVVLCQADLGRAGCNPVCAEFAGRLAAY